MRNRQQTGPRIAIVGGGIGGMAAAAFLHRAGLTVTVHEQAAALTEVGAGLVLAPNAVRPLRALGVAESALRRAVPLDWGWEFRRWEDGTVLSAERLDGVCERLYGERTYTAHRAHLLDALRSAVPDEAVRLGARCTAVEPHAGGVRLTFADGSRADADLVIGADGMHSLVREAVAEPERPRFSGLCAFRTVVPAAAAPEFALRRAQTLWLGPGHHFVHYPISGGAGVNVVAFAPATAETEESWSATATVEEFHAEFADWDERVTKLIKSGAVPGRWALYDRPPLPSWSRGRMTLLGDAAHAMFPFYGQGPRRHWRTRRSWPAASPPTRTPRTGPSPATSRSASRAPPASNRRATPAPTPTTCRTARSSGRGTRRSGTRIRWWEVGGSTGTTRRWPRVDLRCCRVYTDRRRPGPPDPRVFPVAQGSGRVHRGDTKAHGGFRHGGPYGGTTGIPRGTTGDWGCPARAPPLSVRTPGVCQGCADSLSRRTSWARRCTPSSFR